MPGRLVGIYTATEGGKPMDSRDAGARRSRASVSKAIGTPTKTGEFSDRDGGGREVTLIAREAIAAANAADVTIGEGESRRNLVTEGVDLEALIGKQFAVGDVVLLGVRDCPPCAYLEELTGQAVRRGLRNRGGLRADIVRAARSASET